MFSIFLEPPEALISMWKQEKMYFCSDAQKVFKLIEIAGVYFIVIMLYIACKFTLRIVQAL